MSYKALYRTYRPQNFDEIKGQDYITKTLKNIIKSGKISHAYLFSGPRGTGKTSAAKVFANVLNCKDLSEDLKTCLKCDYCESSKNGQTLDVLEIDAASNNGVAEIRELRENVKYAASIAKYKVYIIDEVHMLTKGAFNALLKTLEEPPQHIIFILATTEPHKIPITIISRTQRFNFRRVEKSILESHLEEVLKKENIEYDKSSISMVAKLANGGMRDALSIIDQVSAYSNGKIEFDSIAQVFGIISKENLINILNHSGNKKIESLLQLSTTYIDGGADIQRMTMSLIEILKDFLVFNKTNQGNLMKTLTMEDIPQLEFSVHQAYAMLDILIELLTQLARSEYPRQAFELALLKMTRNEKIIEKEEIKLKTITDVKEEPTPKKIKEEKIAEVEPVDNLFTTQELTQPQLKSKVSIEDIESTTQVIENVLEKTAHTEEIEDVVSTQEFSITPEKEDKSVEKEKTKKQEMTTDDLFSLFETEGSKSEIKAVNKKNTIAEIINLLVQTNSESILNIKRKWSNILSFATNAKYSKFVTLLEECKIISASGTFMLISSIKDEVINSLSEVTENSNFIDLIDTVFEKPLRVFPITKMEFTNVKARYAILSNSNNLPEPTPVALATKKPKEKTEAEKLGSDLFGDLFTF